MRSHPLRLSPAAAISFSTSAPVRYSRARTSAFRCAGVRSTIVFVSPGSTTSGAASSQFIAPQRTHSRKIKPGALPSAGSLIPCWLQHLPRMRPASALRGGHCLCCNRWRLAYHLGVGARGRNQKCRLTPARTMLVLNFTLSTLIWVCVPRFTYMYSTLALR